MSNPTPTTPQAFAQAMEFPVLVLRVMPPLVRLVSGMLTVAILRKLVETVQASLDIRRLKKTDRCDRCGAAATVAFGFDGSELMFCAHHYHKYSDGLKKSSAVIVGQGNNIK